MSRVVNLRKLLLLLLVAAIGCSTLGECSGDDDVEIEEELELDSNIIGGISQTAATTLADVKNEFNVLSPFCGTYFERTYEKINHYLVDNVEDAGLENNMRAANEWLQKLGKSLGSVCLRKALEQFTALKMLDDEQVKCSGRAYAILYKNDRATRGRAHRIKWDLSTLRRIDSLIYQYSLKHAIDCVPKYPEIFAKRYAQLDAERLAKVETFAIEIIDKQLRYKKQLFGGEKRIDVKIFDMGELTEGIKTLRGSRSGQVVFDVIKRLAKDDPERIYLYKVLDEKDAQMKIRADKLRELFNSYLVEPCKYYIAELGLEVFIPAGYDLKMFDAEDRYHLVEAFDLYTGWVRYKICKFLAIREQEALAKDLLDYVTRKVEFVEEMRAGVKN